MPPDLDLDLIRCFLAVVECGGFTAAAGRLHLSQSAVSLKVQRLESLLEKEVFIRSSRSLKLTAEGEVVLGYGRRLLALNQEMLDRIQQSNQGGTLRLGVMPQFGLIPLPELLSQFKRSHPKIRLSVEVGMTSQMLTKLEAEEMDLVIGASGRPVPVALLEESLLLREQVVWVRAAGSLVDPSEDPLSLVLFPEPCLYRLAALERLEVAGRSWEAVYTSASLASVQAAVLADLGIGVLGERSVVPGMKVIATKGRQALPPLPDMGISIYRRKSSSNTLARVMGDFVSRAVDMATH
ncbi:LysR substrate-binding domain-containing protein [Verrucomicrobium sp. BvORR034]|uniref:LysR substrate-binding domain-containing protein n=1 Tax=Verrucomicrobium sp. BvORR034 TaxID=1396418 RepID=UPI0006786A09|nr:LysR substrate-binding domain-containing protein [Verrucomicrobium sp. BvORR034]